MGALIRPALLLSALVLAAAPAAAQTPGLPVFGGGGLRGIELGAAVGFADAGSPVGEATTFVGTLTVGIQRVSVQGAVGLLDPAGPTSADLAGGALASVRVISGGVHSPLSVDLLGGVGVYNGPETLYRHAVAGASFILAMPTPVVSIRPWLAPRVDWRSIDPTDGSELDRVLGGSAGVDLRFLGGPSLRFAWDKIEGAEHTIGIGAAWHF